MKIRTNSYIASLVAAAALMHSPANAADNRLWREQIPASAPVQLTLEAASTRVALASDDWLWREHVPAPAAAPLYITFTTVDAGPSAHALWREQVGRPMRHSRTDVVRASEGSGN